MEARRRGGRSSNDAEDEGHDEDEDDDDEEEEEEEEEQEEITAGGGRLPMHGPAAAAPAAYPPVPLPHQQAFQLTGRSSAPLTEEDLPIHALHRADDSFSMGSVGFDPDDYLMRGSFFSPRPLAPQESLTLMIAAQAAHIAAAADSPSLQLVPARLPSPPQHQQQEAYYIVQQQAELRATTASPTGPAQKSPRLR